MFTRVGDRPTTIIKYQCTIIKFSVQINLFLFSKIVMIISFKVTLRTLFFIINRRCITNHRLLGSNTIVFSWTLQVVFINIYLNDQIVF